MAVTNTLSPITNQVGVCAAIYLNEYGSSMSCRAVHNMGMEWMRLIKRDRTNDLGC